MTRQRILIVYYSWTGTTRKAAEALTEILHCDIEEIVEAHGRKGFFGYLRSVVEARMERPAVIDVAKRDPASYDLVVVATPIWAWSVSSPVRAYLTAMKARLPDVAFFCTLGGAGSARAFAQMQDISGKAPRAQCVVTAKEMSYGQYRKRVSAFAQALGSSLAGPAPMPITERPRERPLADQPASSSTFR